MSEKIIAKKENGVGWLILNNPERHNAISLEMWTAAMEAMHDFRADPSVRVMVMTGAGGKAFASGADISKFKDERQEAAAVAHVCYQFDVAFVVIRALSDIAGKESSVSFDEFLPMAAKHSTEIVFNVISQLAASI